MDCKVQVKAQEKYGKGADCKGWEKVQRSFGKENFYENGVKRRQNFGKAELCKAAGETTASGIYRAEAAASGGKLRQTSTRQIASEGKRQEVPEGKTTTAMREGRGMAKKENRQASRHLAAENGTSTAKRRKPHQPAVKAISTYY